MRCGSPLARVLLAAALSAGCSKAPAPKPASSAPAKAAAAPGTTAEPDYAKLAIDYRTIRCQLLGSALPDEQLYAKQGYADGAAFQTAFADAAKRKPDWAKQTLSDAIARTCGEPGAPTPTSAPNPATAVQP